MPYNRAARSPPPPPPRSTTACAASMCVTQIILRLRRRASCEAAARSCHFRRRTCAAAVVAVVSPPPPPLHCQPLVVVTAVAAAIAASEAPSASERSHERSDIQKIGFHNRLGRLGMGLPCLTRPPPPGEKRHLRRKIATRWPTRSSTLFAQDVSRQHGPRDRLTAHSDRTAPTCEFGGPPPTTGN